MRRPPPRVRPAWKYAAHAPSVETIGAPSGRSGVHSVPNAGQSCGFARPRSTSPRDADLGLARRGCRRRRGNRTRRRARGTRSRRRSPLCGITPMPRQARSQISKTSRDDRAGPRALPLAHRRPARTGSPPRPALLELPHEHQDPLEQVERLEPGHDERDAEVARRSARTRVQPMIAQTWPGAEEPLHAVPRRGEDRRDRGRHQDVRRRAAEVRRARAGAPAAPPSRSPARSSRSRRRRTRPSCRGCAAATSSASSGE